MWWKENLVKHRKASKYYETDWRCGVSRKQEFRQMQLCEKPLCACFWMLDDKGGIGWSKLVALGFLSIHFTRTFSTATIMLLLIGSFPYEIRFSPYCSNTLKAAIFVTKLAAHLRIFNLKFQLNCVMELLLYSHPFHQ